jgi:hypothetical protein
MSSPATLEVDSAPFDALVGAEIFAFIIAAAPGPVRNRIVKSLDHLIRAERLQGVDEEMGALRLIAAEEELVVAIFEWLRQEAEHFPEHADFVRQFKRHPVKQSLHPVLREFRMALEGNFEGFTIEGLEDVIDWRPWPVIEEGRILLQITDKAGAEIFRHDPLAIAITLGDLASAEAADALYETFAKRLKEQLGMSVADFVRTKADFRNSLLYATDQGSAVMHETLGELLEIFRPVLRDLLWTVAILLGWRPPKVEWGLVSQFFRVYRRVLADAGLIKKDVA